MKALWQDISVILSEFILILGALLSLIYGAYAKNTRGVIILTIGTLLCSFYALTQTFFLHIAITAFNGMLVSNALTHYGKLLVLTTSVAFFFMLSSNIYKGKFISFEFPILILISIAGMMLMISSNSLISLYLCMEMMSLPLYILAASNRHNSKSTEAGIKYFILGSLSSGIFLFGASLVYGFTGAIDFGNIYDYYASLNLGSESTEMSIGFMIGMVFIIVAFAFKISAVPFHMWTPDVYEGSPTLITAFLASAPKVAGILILVRTLLDPFAELYDKWQQIIIFIAAVSMLVGSLGAIVQSNFKRLLAYSSISHVGFAIAGLATTENTGVWALLVYITIYISMILATFACLMLLRQDGNEVESIYDFSGLAKSNPNISLCITILLLSMAGIPPFAGFFAKFYILIPILEAQMYVLAILFVICSVISTFYYLKIIKVMYFDTTEKKLQVTSSFGLKMVAITGALINILYIFIPTPILRIAEQVSITLFR